MAVGYFKLDIGRAVAPADVPKYLAGGPFTILRVDTRGATTTVHFCGEKTAVGKVIAKAVAVKPADIAKL